MSYAAALWFAVHEEVETKEGCSNSYSGLGRFDDVFLFKNFHLNRPAINFIIDCVRARLERITNWSNALSIDAVVLAALFYYANGFYSKEIADLIGISQASVGNAVNTVSKVLSDKLDEFITFPNSHNDRVLVAHEIQKVCRVPNIVGVLGCLHTRIIPPPEDAVLYMNCMDYHSIMSQMVCDSQGNLLSVENQWPGSTAEQSIWESSKICQQFKSGRYRDNWLIGGSCYSLSKYVLTPLTYVRNQPSLRYNDAHFKIQSKIQKTFGALKIRFRCLEKLGEINMYVPNKAAETVNACCVLHNIAKKFSVALPEELVLGPLNHTMNREVFSHSDYNLLLLRQIMINTLFSQDSSIPPLLDN